MVLELWRHWEERRDCRRGYVQTVPWTSCWRGGLGRLGDPGEYATRFGPYPGREQLRVRQQPVLRTHSPFAPAESVMARLSNRASQTQSRSRRRGSAGAQAVRASAALVKPRVSNGCLSSQCR
jgi:hypothetical protein